MGNSSSDENNKLGFQIESTMTVMRVKNSVIIYPYYVLCIKTQIYIHKKNIQTHNVRAKTIIA